MADLVISKKTSLPGADVIVRAVQFFTSGKWRIHSQSDRTATFAGRPPIPLGMIFLTVIGFAMCIVPGIILYIMVIKKMIQLQNIVITVSPISGGTEVVVKYPKHAAKLGAKFLESLPPLSDTSA